MKIGQTIIAKVEGNIAEGIVISMTEEEVTFLCNGKEITRKYWEVIKMPEDV